MLSKIANYLGFSYKLEEDSHQVNQHIRERLDRMEVLPYLYNQDAKPMTFRYRADTISLLPRQNSGQSAFPRINVKYTHRRKEVAQFVFEVRDQELTVKQYNAPPIVQLNRVQRVLKVHRKTKANAALFFLSRIVDRTHASREATKLKHALQRVSVHRNQLARTEVVPVNAKSIIKQTAHSLRSLYKVLKQLSKIETPTAKREAMGKLKGILDIANRAGDTILERAAQYPELKLSVNCRSARRSLSKVVKELANFAEFEDLQGGINHLKENLIKFEQLR